DLEGDVFRAGVADDDLGGKASEAGLDAKGGGSAQGNALARGAKTSAEREFANPRIVFTIGCSEGGLDLAGEAQARVIALAHAGGVGRAVQGQGLELGSFEARSSHGSLGRF